MKKVREVVAYQDHFENFLKKQTIKVQNKIYKVIEAIETFERVPRITFDQSREAKDSMKPESNWGQIFGGYSASLMVNDW